MTIKSADFKLREQEIAQIAKLFSHPARIAIMEYLAYKKNCISGDIAQELPLSRTTVSQHLQELKKAGLIKGTIEGTKINYCIDKPKFEACWKKLDEFYQSINLGATVDCDC